MSTTRISREADLRKAETDLRVAVALEKQLDEEYQRALREKGLECAFREFGTLLVHSQNMVIDAEARVAELRQGV